MPTRKRAETIAEEMAPEYDFAAMRKAVRGKYYERMKRGSNLILLDPDLAEAFPTSEAVNGALRSLLELARKVDERGSKHSRRRARSTK
jgi:hypothetical protein